MTICGACPFSYLRRVRGRWECCAGRSRGLDDEGVVWDSVLCRWERCWSGCEKVEVLVPWRRYLCRNKDRLKVHRRIRQCRDCRQRQRWAEGVVRWRPQCKLRTLAKFWYARMRCKKDKQMLHEERRHLRNWSRRIISVIMSGWNDFVEKGTIGTLRYIYRSVQRKRRRDKRYWKHPRGFQ